MRHKLKVLVKDEALDVKPQQTMNSANKEYQVKMQAPGRGVLPGILGGGVPPGSPNPDPISNPKKVIFFTRFQTRLLNSMIG